MINPFFKKYYIQNWSFYGCDTSLSLLSSKEKKKDLRETLSALQTS